MIASIPLPLLSITANRKEKTMTIYNVLFESNYDDEYIHSEVCSFSNIDKARKCLEKAIADELMDYCYDDDEIADRLDKQENGSFTFYADETHSDWKFRGVLSVTELD